MERLTESRKYYDCEFMEDGIAPYMNKLAAYEDTGLEPEEIREKVGFMSPVCIGCDGKTADGKRTEKCTYEDDCVKCLERSAHLSELALAEEQGRLVVLPCKVGDKVYRLWPCGKNGKSISEMVVNHVDIDFLPEIEFACRKDKATGNYWFFKATDIGKTYYLTREEAEKALEWMG